MPASRRHFLSACLALPAAAAAASGHEWRPWPRHRATPTFALVRLGGGITRLESLRGQPVLLNFWTSWCAPCREELPSLAQRAARHAADGLEVLAVNVRESPDTVGRFVQQEGLTLPVLLDSSGNAARAFTPRIYPSTVFIDRRGRATGVLVGAIDWLGDEAGQRLDALLRR